MFEKNITFNEKKNTKVSALPWELQNFSVVLFYGEALKSNVRSISTMKLIWHYESYRLFDLSILKDLIKRKAFKGFTFTIDGTSFGQLTMSLIRMLGFEYFIFSFASKAKPSFIFPSKAATQFSFSCKWRTLKNSSSFFNANACTQFTPTFVPQEEQIDQEKKKVLAVKYECPTQWSHCGSREGWSQKNSVLELVMVAKGELWNSWGKITA